MRTKNLNYKNDVINFNNLEPYLDELPSKFSERLSNLYSSLMSHSKKRDIGQFFTSYEVSNFMAHLANVFNDTISILDPGSGTGILSCSLIEFLTYNGVKTFNIIAYENDKNIINLTNMSYKYLKDYFNLRNIEINYTILCKDFIEDNHAVLDDNNLFYEQLNSFDYIISNPPYFKINLNDSRAKLANTLIHGQPNIYSIFLGISAKLINETGQIIFINPRSFTAGYYFRLFREKFFEEIKIEHIHLFESRIHAFKKDDVLQELLILSGTKRKSSKNDFIYISTSLGKDDLNSIIIKPYFENDLIDLKSKNKILYLPTSDYEFKIIKLFRKWNNNLKDFNMNISTGPVVSFRADNLISEIDNSNTVPLLWMNNIKFMIIEWPFNKNGKGQYINFSEMNLPLFILNKNLILLRRFSTKDDKKRLIAAPLLKDNFNYEYLGIENKLNYIYKENDDLSVDEIYGFSALFNSSLYDSYFRTFNGNINVSATEIREMTFPNIKEIKMIGNKIKTLINLSQNDIDNIVNEILKIKEIL